MLTVTLRDETVGGRPGGLLKVELHESTLTVRELIRRRVEAEARRQAASPAPAPAAGVRLVPRAEAERRLNAPRRPEPVGATVEAMCERAWRAFERNGFFVLVGDHQVEALDERVTLSAETEVVFVRLLPLVGG